MSSLKHGVKRGILRSRVLRAASSWTSSKVVILRYHSVQDDPAPFAQTIGWGIIHSAAAFAEQMEMISCHYHPVSIADVHDFLGGGKVLPDRAVAVTFDDGYADNYEIAAPILQRFGVPGAFYATVKNVETSTPPWYCRLRNAFHVSPRYDWPDGQEDRVWPMGTRAERHDSFLSASRRLAKLAGEPQMRILVQIENELEVQPLGIAGAPMMTWEQLRGLIKGGHIVGSHTMTHPNLAYVDDAVVRLEMKESKRVMEERLEGPVVHFSYPSPILQPHFTEATIERARQAGYQTSLTCVPGVVRRGQEPLALRRVFAPFEKNDFQWGLEWAFLGRYV
jgi:peptidoglycan/xylan/chitin deacetylase (PgdA/CDA1 family)